MELKMTWRNLSNQNVKPEKIKLSYIMNFKRKNTSYMNL